MGQVEQLENGRLERMKHMAPADRALMARWLNRNPEFFDYIEYDVEVSPAYETDGLAERRDRELYAKLRTKRIDAVGHVGDRIYVIEVKPMAGSSCLGQIQMYLDLYIKKYRPTAPVYPMIITDILDSDCAALYERYGIITAILG